MKITVELDELTVTRLDIAAETQIGGRDWLIWRAVNQWLTQDEEKIREAHTHQAWPEEVKNFKGFPDLIPFESYRDELPHRGEDSLA